MADPISFDLIEPHKENILPLSHGRSARALAASLNPPNSTGSTPQSTRDAHASTRAAYESELLTSYELDDPLEVWVRYVTWTIETYPSGHTSSSGLLPLLERATKAFIHEPHYKNDPRYLKFWIYYIQQFSDAPREHFAYLARNDIGQRLALFFEEFAGLLETQGRWKQAREIYQLGIENNARPVERLLRKYDEFVRRMEVAERRVDEPSSPALPPVRPALAAKTLPFSEGSGGAGGFPDPQAQAHAQATAGGGRQIKREKMAIFADQDGSGQSAAAALGPGTGGWDSIGTLEHRRKENIMEPRPWAGEVMKQAGGGGRAVGGEKLSIFRDALGPSPSQVPAHRLADPPMFPNARYVYPNPNNPMEEYSFEELRAMSRNLLGINWARRRAAAAKPTSTSTSTTPTATSTTREAQPRSSSKRSSSSPFSMRPQTKTIAAKLQSPSPSRGKLKKRSQQAQSGSPTMTLHTRAATDEIYDILSQPMDHPNKDLDEESDFFVEEGDETVEVTARNAASGTSDEDDSAESGDEEEGEEDDNDGSDWSGDEGTRKVQYVDETVGLTDDTFFQRFDKMSKKDGGKGEEDSDDDVDDDGKERDGKATGEDEDDELGLPPPLTDMQPRKLFGGGGGGGEAGGGGGGGEKEHRRGCYMTPIVERTEVSLPPTTARRKAAAAAVAKTPSRPKHARGADARKRELELIMSSPFQEGVEIPSVEGVAGEVGGGKSSGGSKTGEEKQEDGDEIDFFLPLPAMKGVIKDKDKDKEGDQENERAIEKGSVGSNGREMKKAPLGVKKQMLLGSSAPPPPPAAGIRDYAPKGPIITETQLNPMDSEIRKTILSKINPPVSGYEGYYEYPRGTKSKAVEIRKTLRPLPKTSSSNASPHAAMSDVLPVKFPGKPGKNGAVGKGHAYTFQRQIGEGAFAPIYLVENQVVAAVLKEKEEGDCADGDGDGDGGFGLVTETRLLRRRKLEVVKLEQDPPSSWEFYVMRQAHRRLGVSRASESIIYPLEIHYYPPDGGDPGASFLVLPYQPQGTILDLVNLSTKDTKSSPSPGLDETLSMFLTVELLRTIEALHNKGLIHGDLKADNCLIRFEDVPSSEAWENKYRKDGSGGWKLKGLTLIDFGRGIDMKVFQEDKVGFVADWKADPQRDCVEMREMRPWTYQIDYYGAAGVVHSMLFGKYLEAIPEKNDGGVGIAGRKTWKVKEGFKRYWQGEIWARCFDVLLNPGRFVTEEDGGRLPVTKAVRGVREEMEKWLEGNADKGVGLRAMIRRLEQQMGKVGKR